MKPMRRGAPSARFFLRWVMPGLAWPMARLIWYMGTRALLAMLAKVWRRP